MPFFQDLLPTLSWQLQELGSKFSNRSACLSDHPDGAKLQARATQRHGDRVLPRVQMARASVKEEEQHGGRGKSVWQLDKKTRNVTVNMREAAIRDNRVLTTSGQR